MLSKLYGSSKTDPGEGGPELPGYEEAQRGRAGVQRGGAGGGLSHQESGGGGAGQQRDQDQVPWPQHRGERGRADLQKGDQADTQPIAETPGRNLSASALGEVTRLPTRPIMKPPL